MSFDADVILEFIAETREYIASLEALIVHMHEDAQPDHIHEAFRILHTIKGTAGFLGLNELQDIAHAAESRLAEIREGKRRYDSALTDQLIDVVDYIRSVIDALESGTSPPPPPTRLRTALLGTPDEPEPEPPADGEGTLCTEGGLAGPGRQASGTPEIASPTAASTMRVRVASVDSLINVVGELVIARNELVERVAACDIAPRRHLQRLSQLIDEVQDAAIKLRMQPISTVFSRLPRLVREAAKMAGKDVQLVVEGDDTEIDRSLAEPLPDMLLHLIRNAIDHGIEPADERIAKGKPPRGVLRVRAYQHNGRVLIDVSDDGRGIDPHKVKDIAVRRGLLSKEQASQMSDADAVSLIFTPGFSSADTPTELSGRGVGLDAVRNLLERIGGGVHVSSEVGTGTTFTINLPSNLTIVPAVSVTVDGREYALPTSCVGPILKLGSPKAALVTADGARGILLHDTFLPVYELQSALAKSPVYVSDSHGGRYLVVVRTDAHQAGFAVDGLGDVTDTFVKPLNQFIQRNTLFSGACIQGNGRPVFLVDPFKLLAILPTVAMAPHGSDSPCQTTGLDVLLVRAGNVTIALPLDRVVHVVRGVGGSVTACPSGTFLRWYDMLLPAIPLLDSERDPRQFEDAVLCVADNSIFALLVDAVLDLVAAPSDYPHSASRDPQWLGYGTIGSEVVPLLNVPRLALFLPHGQLQS